MPVEITTAVPAAVDTLAGLLSDRLRILGLACERGMPHPDSLAGGHTRVWIPLGDASATHSQTYRVTNLTAKQEDFEIPVCLFVHCLTTHTIDARTKLDPAIDAVLATISTHPTLDGAVMLAQATTVTREEAAPDPTVRQMAATIRVRCQAWLTA